MAPSAARPLVASMQRARRDEESRAEMKVEVRQHAVQKARGEWEARAQQPAERPAQGFSWWQDEDPSGRPTGNRQWPYEPAETPPRIQTTAAERRAELTQQAYELAARREAKRAAEAAELQLQRLAANSDELRTERSRQLARQGVQQWAGQRADAQHAQQQEAQRMQRTDRELEGLAQRLEEQHQAGVERRRLAREELGAALDRQCELREAVEEQERWRQEQQARLLGSAEQAHSPRLAHFSPAETAGRCARRVARR
jgi:hypothetical protein